MFSLLFGLNLATKCHYLSRSVCHVQYVNLLCLYPIGFPYWFDLIGSIIMTQLVLSGDFNKLVVIPHSLFLLIIYNLIFFPPPPLGRW